MSSDETRDGIEGAHEPEVDAKEREERERTFARRALLQSSWAIPVVLALGMPQNAYAVNQSIHDDEGHTDGGHSDAHEDCVHDDINLHTDTPHGDVHIDFNDGPPRFGDGHADRPHGDATAHGDSVHCDG